MIFMPDAYLALPHEQFQAQETLSILKLLHTSPTGKIGFHQKSENGWKCLSNYLVSELTEEIILPLLSEKNVYCNVNSFRSYKSGFFSWKEAHLRHLEALYLDLDVGRSEGGLSAAEAIERLLTECREEGFPAPSFTAESGQGAYALWRLRDIKKPELPCLNTPANLAKYKAIGKALWKRFEHLKADEIDDAARVLRLPNSLHENGNRVKYFVNLEAGSGVNQYTLGEMVEGFNVKLEVPFKRSTKPPKPFEPESLSQMGERGCKGLKSLHTRRTDDIKKIIKAKKVKKGARRFILSIFIESHRALRTCPKKTKRQAQALSKKLSPPYPSDISDERVSKIVERTYQLRPAEIRELKVTNNFIFKQLGWKPTPQESDKLGLETIRAKHPNRTQKRQERHKALKSLREKPSIRRALKFLTEQGFEVSRSTVRADLEAVFC